MQICSYLRTNEGTIESLWKTLSSISFVSSFLYHFTHNLFMNLFTYPFYYETTTLWKVFKCGEKKYFIGKLYTVVYPSRWSASVSMGVVLNSLNLDSQQQCKRIITCKHVILSSGDKTDFPPQLWTFSYRHYNILDL